MARTIADLARSIREGHPSAHPEIDTKVLEFTRIMVARIGANPALARVGLDNIKRWTAQKGENQ